MGSRIIDHILSINDKNSTYIGDGAYAHKYQWDRLWVFTHNGEEILDKICLEHEVFDSLLRFYRSKFNVSVK